MLNKYFAVLLGANFSILVNSQTSGLKESNFRAYRNIKFIGGLNKYVHVSNKFKCILECTSKASCQGFTYEGDTCQQVDRSKVTGLDFVADPINSRIRRNVLLQNMNFDPNILFTEHTVTLVNKLSIGDIIYLKAKLFKHNDVLMEIYEQPSKENITYEIRARCVTSCSNYYVSINNKFNNVWSASSGAHLEYPLVENEVFELHVLITANGIMAYFNGVLWNTLRSAMSAASANFVHIYGNMEILEFSL